jgi:hypothetical protein
VPRRHDLDELEPVDLAVVDRVAGRVEDGAHAISGVLEHPPSGALDALDEEGVVRGQGHGHGPGIVLPPARRGLDVGEQQRHRPVPPDGHLAKVVDACVAAPTGCGSAAITYAAAT